MQTDPTVSIIISAYNRPQVIAFAIKSVLASDFDDWELIVVGDGCNAETEAAIRAFADPRIKFDNLPENTGFQSAPHNRALEMARGEFIFYLNQDDLFFPDHISKRVAFMRETGADISWSPVLLLQHSGLVSGPVDVEMDRLSLDGVPAEGRFDPRCFVISSCRAVRREICRAVGPWLSIDGTRISPSQEWLYRAHLKGCSILYHPYVSVLCIHAGVRRYSYVSAQSFEHERAWSWIAAGPEERLKLMHCVAVQESAELAKVRLALEGSVHPLRTFVEKSLEKVGIHPHTTQRVLEGVGKGEGVRSFRRFTSQPPVLPLNVHLPVSSDAANDFLGRGWHAAEPHGRWTAGIAEIFFSAPTLDDGAGSLLLEIYGHAWRAGEKVNFALNGGTPISRTIDGTDEVITIPLPGPGNYCLTIAIEQPIRPQSVGLSEDRRLLGYWLTWLRLVSHPVQVEIPSPALSH